MIPVDDGYHRNRTTDRQQTSNSSTADDFDVLQVAKLATAKFE